MLKKKKKTLETSALITIEFWEGMRRYFAVYFLEYGGNWTDSLFQSRGGFSYCGQCLFRVIGKLLIHVLMSHV